MSHQRTGLAELKLNACLFSSSSFILAQADTDRASGTDCPAASEQQQEPLSFSQPDVPQDLPPTPTVSGKPAAAAASHESAVESAILEASV